MNSSKSAGFPLNISYHIIKKIQKYSNNGSVHVQSAKRGEYLELIKVNVRCGISLGDMIGLNRKNIQGFDVRGLYVELFELLKKKGL